MKKAKFFLLLMERGFKLVEMNWTHEHPSSTEVNTDGRLFLRMRVQELSTGIYTLSLAVVLASQLHIPEFANALPRVEEMQMDAVAREIGKPEEERMEAARLHGWNPKEEEER